MPTPLPQSVQETLGAPAAGDFARWLETYVEERAVARDERPDREGGSTPGVYREVLTRLDVIDERIDETNERLDRMDERFEKRSDQIDQRLDEQSAQFNQRLDEQSRQLNERIDAVNERFDGVNERFDAMNERFDAMNERIDRLHEQMRVQTRWTVGTIALFGTIVTVLLAIAEFSA